MLAIPPSPRMVDTKLKSKAPTKPQFKPPTTTRIMAIVFKIFKCLTPFRKGFPCFNYTIFATVFRLDIHLWLIHCLTVYNELKGIS